MTGLGTILNTACILIGGVGRGGRPPESRRNKLREETATEARRFKRGG